MSVNTDLCSRESCYRQAFSVTPPSSNGLICRVHHTIIMGHGTVNQRIRFLHATFNSSGDILALHNHLGNVYIFDFTCSKYWFLVHINCSLIKFVPEMKTGVALKETLLIGTTNGNICVYNSHTSQHVSNLVGHTNPVNDISCSANVECVTLANNEAIIWELENFTKLQVLQLEEGSILRFVMFIPVSNNLIGCFNDDILQIWRAATYDTINLMADSIGGEFAKLRIRTIAFTSNGKLMAIAGHSSTIFILDVESLKLRKEFSFTEMHVTVKKALFIPNVFDDGVNKILSFLTSSGTLFFYNMEFGTLVNKITVDEEIWKYTVDSFSNKVATISKAGEIQIYVLSYLLPKLQNIKGKLKSQVRTKAKASKCGETNNSIKNKMNTVLNTGKLKAILKEFGEYPGIYRKIIWQHLLQLPCDDSQYTPIFQGDCKNAFEEFEKLYSLEVKQDMESLKRFTELLVVWCPFLSVVSYLPVLIFPFIKFLQNEPVLCFELLMTLIVNYCQYWFEYHPVPPLNVLGLVESLLYQEDLELLGHLSKIGVTSKTYAWFLLQSMFSEVFTSSNWLIFCDHLMSHNATFLIVAVAAYSLVNRKVLMIMDNVEDFDLFYRTINNIDFKQFIARCYKLFNDKTTKNHPREYLTPYIPFEKGKYPIFTQYPKNCIEVCNSINDLRSEANSVKIEEEAIRAKIEELKKLTELEKSQEDFERHAQLNKLYCEKLEEEKQNVEKERKKLNSLKLNMLNKGYQFNCDSQTKIETNNNSFSNLSKSTDSKDCTMIEEHLLKHYTNLLKHKIQIEGLVDDNVSLDFIQLKKNYKEIFDEGNKVQTQLSTPRKEYLMQLNIITGLSAVDSLISKVESRILDRSTTMDRTKTKNVVLKLVEESDELSHEITKLMNLITASK